jgi:hypothetical protein
MRLLADLTTLKQRMVINPDLTGVDEPLKQAILAAQLRLQSFFDSELQEAEYEDMFFLDSEAFSGVTPGGLMKLYLTSGFVQATGFEIYYGDTYNEAILPVDVLLYRKDPLRGHIMIDANEYRDKFVRVKYKAGFPDIVAPTINPPTWLEEAILAYAPFAAEMGSVGTKEDADTKSYKAAAEHALAVIAPYSRNTGFCIRKLF